MATCCVPDARWPRGPDFVLERGQPDERGRSGAVPAAPIVFCRNAFIYFSPAAVRPRRRSRSLAAMPAPGYLCVGASESLVNVTRSFALEEVDGAFVYVKRGWIPESCVL